MGNSHVGHRKGSDELEVVTILQSDGRVLKFPHSCRVADLLAEFPDHFVCHSSSLVLLHQGKMLPPDAMLVLGEAYFLLPLPNSNSGRQSASGAENVASLSSGLPTHEEGKSGRTMKFLISKQQLAKILAEGFAKVGPSEPLQRTLSLPSVLSESNASTRANSTRVLHRTSPTLVRRTVTWSPGLDGISEVPLM